MASAWPRSLSKVSLELGGPVSWPSSLRGRRPRQRGEGDSPTRDSGTAASPCSSDNRVYAHRDIHDGPRLEGRRRSAEKMTMGDGLSDGAVDLGPMATADGVRTSEAPCQRTPYRKGVASAPLRGKAARGGRVRPGQLLPPHRPHRRHARDAGHARGDLRAGRTPRPSPPWTRPWRNRQRHAVRPRGLPLHPRPRDHGAGVASSPRGRYGVREPWCREHQLRPLRGMEGQRLRVGALPQGRVRVPEDEAHQGSLMLLDGGGPQPGSATR